MARPVARIGPLLERLRRAWERCPDMRLGQLAANVRRDPSQLYAIEDETLVAAIEAAYPAPALTYDRIPGHPAPGPAAPAWRDLPKHRREAVRRILESEVSKAARNVEWWSNDEASGHHDQAERNLQRSRWQEGADDIRLALAHLETP